MEKVKGALMGYAMHSFVAQGGLVLLALIGSGSAMDLLLGASAMGLFI